MYAQLSISNQLPAIDYALNYQRTLVAGNWLMLISVSVIALCILAAYGFEQQLTIPALVAAHLAMVVFAGFLKVGYVMRAIALKAFGSRCPQYVFGENGPTVKVTAGDTSNPRSIYYKWRFYIHLS